MNNADKPIDYVSITDEEQIHLGYDNRMSGLTKREEFTRTAMLGLLSSSHNCDGYKTPEEWIKNITESAVEFADAQLKELNK